MTDFVLEQRMKTDEVNKATFYAIQTHIYEYYDKIFAYATFLKQPLTIGMFVPCDENTYILEEPADDNYAFYTHKNVSLKEEYQDAKQKILFEGFEVKESIYDDTGQSLFIGWKPYNSAIFLKLQGEEWKLDDFKTVEDLLQSGYEIELSDSAIKQIGL